MPDGLGAVLLRLIVAEAGAGRQMLPLALRGAWLRRCPGWLQTAKELAAAPEMLRSTASGRPPTPDLKRTAVRTVAEGSRSGGCAPGLTLGRRVARRPPQLMSPAIKGQFSVVECRL